MVRSQQQNDPTLFQIEVTLIILDWTIQNIIHKFVHNITSLNYLGQKNPNSLNHPKMTYEISFWPKTSKILKNSRKHAKWTKPSNFCPWNKVLPNFRPPGPFYKVKNYFPGWVGVIIGIKANLSPINWDSFLLFSLPPTHLPIFWSGSCQLS